MMNVLKGRRTSHKDKFISFKELLPTITVKDPVTHDTWDHGKFTTYLICIRTDHPAFHLHLSAVRRRFSELWWLYRVLKANHSYVNFPKPPPKKILSEKFEREFINSRMTEIQSFLNELMMTDTVLSDAAFHFFVQTDLTIDEIQEYLNGTLPENVVMNAWANCKGKVFLSKIIPHEPKEIFMNEEDLHPAQSSPSTLQHVVIDLNPDDNDVFTSSSHEIEEVDLNHIVNLPEITSLGSKAEASSAFSTHSSVASSTDSDLPSVTNHVADIFPGYQVVADDVVNAQNKMISNTTTNKMILNTNNNAAFTHVATVHATTRQIKQVKSGEDLLSETPVPQTGSDLEACRLNSDRTHGDASLENIPSSDSTVDNVSSNDSTVGHVSSNDSTADNNVSSNDSAPGNISSNEIVALNVSNHGTSSAHVSNHGTSSAHVSNDDSTAGNISSKDSSELDVYSHDFAALDVSSNDTKALDVSSNDNLTIDVSSNDNLTIDVSSNDTSTFDVSSNGTLSFDFSSDDITTNNVSINDKTLDTKLQQRIHYSQY